MDGDEINGFESSGFVVIQSLMKTKNFLCVFPTLEGLGHQGLRRLMASFANLSLAEENTETTKRTVQFLGVREPRKFLNPTLLKFQVSFSSLGKIVVLLWSPWIFQDLILFFVSARILEEVSDVK